MAKLVYSTITSLDGYTTNEAGDFEWRTPDPEVFAFINNQERGFGTYLYGRRMYETMVYWETFEPSNDEPYLSDFTDIWRTASKIVYSTTLARTSSAKTRIERSFDAATIRELKRTSEQDVSISGPNLASQAIVAGLVDEMHLFVTPVTIGGGTTAHPRGVRTNFELVGVDRFESGVLHLHYHVIR